MPRICPECRKLQPDGPKCHNCGYVYPVPIETSQGTQTSVRQLVSYGLYIIGFVVVGLIVVVALVGLLFSCAS
jgi:hypothetical protein